MPLPGQPVRVAEDSVSVPVEQQPESFAFTFKASRHSPPSSASSFPMHCIVRERPKGFTKAEKVSVPLDRKRSE
jgi:hypothetical protein